MAFLETGAFVGLIAPGEFTVIIGGVVAGQGEIDIVPLIGLAWFCCVLGDSASFLLGHRLGRAFLVKHGPKVRIDAGDAREGRGLLRPPRRQDGPDRPLHRARPRDRAVHRRLVGHELPAVPAVQHPRHRAVGDDVLAARLLLLPLVRAGREHRGPGHAGRSARWSRSSSPACGPYRRLRERGPAPRSAWLDRQGEASAAAPGGRGRPAAVAPGAAPDRPLRSRRRCGSSAAHHARRGSASS